VRRLLALVVAAGLSAVAGCSDLQGTDGKDYVGGNGSVIEVEPSDRGDPVEAAGETLDGSELDLTDYRGQVVVVNVWGAWCVECRKEMPMLVDAADELPGDTVIFGIDVRDPSRDNALAFERSFDVPYPSLYDPGSEQLLNFPSPVNPRATPSTVVLDREGRIAALISGVVPSKLTLLEVVEKVESEDG
jgi:thiol-disulfide isomerase/thioredoxin